MKNIVKYTLFAVSAALLAVSCSLDQLPTDSVEYKEGARIIATVDDLNSFEAGILADYRAIHGGGAAVVEDVMADGFNAVAGFGNNYGSVHRLDNSYTAADSYIESYWSNRYLVIKDYNVLIDALSEEQNIVKGYEGASNLVKARAYFFRADAYLELIRHFAKNYDPDNDDPLGVPIVLHYDLYGRPSRSSVHTVYKQIKEDLDSAAVYLSEVPGEAMSTVPTQDALNALYARYYLDIQDWENAVKSADSVIKSGKYALSKTATEMEAEFLNDSGTEAIMQMYGDKNRELPNTITAYTNITPDPDYDLVSTPLFLPTKKLVSAYREADLRKTAWFSTDAYYSKINGSFYRGRFSTFIKYLGNPALYNSYPNGAHMTKPFMIAEQYLIKAEAQSRSGNIPGAKATINILQNTRGAAASTGSMSAIKDEWFRETAGDGMRFTCLKRWGDGFDAREGQTGALAVNAIETGTYYDERSLEADDYHFVWPIPSNEIRLNENLKPQNPGYGNN